MHMEMIVLIAEAVNVAGFGGLVEAVKIEEVGDDAAAVEALDAVEYAAVGLRVNQDEFLVLAPR